MFNEIFFLKQLYKGVDKIMRSRGIVIREGMGILKELKSFLFMIMFCCIEKVDSCVKQQFIVIVLKKIGRRFKNVFVFVIFIVEMFLFNIVLFKYLKNSFK